MFRHGEVSRVNPMKHMVFIFMFIPCLFLLWEGEVTTPGITRKCKHLFPLQSDRQAYWSRVMSGSLSSSVVPARPTQSQ